MMFTRKFNRASIVSRRIFIVVAQCIVELIENSQSNNNESISNSRIVTIVESSQSREISINDNLISNRENLRVLNTAAAITILTVSTIFEESQSLSTRARNDATSNLKRQKLNNLNDAKIERELANLKRARVKTVKMKQLIKNREKLIRRFKLNLLMNLIQLNKKKLLKVRDFTSYKDSHQRELNVFIQECNEIFEICRLIYSDDVDKILYAKNMLIETLVQK